MIVGQEISGLREERADYNWTLSGQQYDLLIKIATQLIALHHIKRRSYFQFQISSSSVILFPDWICNGLHPPLPSNGPPPPPYDLSSAETDLLQHLDTEWWWHLLCHWGEQGLVILIHCCCYIFQLSPTTNQSLDPVPSLLCACHKVLIEFVPFPFLARS